MYRVMIRACPPIEGWPDEFALEGRNFADVASAQDAVRVAEAEDEEFGFTELFSWHYRIVEV